MHLDAKVAVTTRILGKLNIIFDGLSRLLSSADVGLDISLEYRARDDATILQFLQLCNPEATIDTTYMSHIVSATAECLMLSYVIYR